MIDWRAQWQAHAKFFSDGYSKIPVPDTSKIVLLQPGPGFGDLSHPTTRQMIDHLKKQNKNQKVLDVGCGSGILSLMANALGFKEICGIDIDPEAVTHATDNAILNQMTVSFFTNNKYFVPPFFPDLILINMIRSEQKMALASLPFLHKKKLTIISSGVLKEEKELYLNECRLRNWTLLEESEEEEWLAFVFKLTSV